mmetsp:Transcript_7155/g.14729  ORF Transcript_7155/g.14729 Transcript_7155/m.14729 type:complete len:142 (-) Transcript_7155:522-947(-)
MVLSQDHQVETTCSSEKPENPTDDDAKKPFVCAFDNCGKSFYKNISLRSHARVHDGIFPYTCRREGCGRRFEWRSSLKSHYECHRRSDYRKCNENFTLRARNWSLDPPKTGRSEPGQCNTIFHVFEPRKNRDMEKTYPKRS